MSNKNSKKIINLLQEGTRTKDKNLRNNKITRALLQKILVQNQTIRFKVVKKTDLLIFLNALDISRSTALLAPDMFTHQATLSVTTANRSEFK